MLITCWVTYLFQNTPQLIDIWWEHILILLLKLTSMFLHIHDANDHHCNEGLGTNLVTYCYMARLVHPPLHNNF